MALQNYSVRYNLTGAGAFTTLDNVQSIDFMHGRQRQLDTYSASMCTVRMRYPTGYTQPIVDLVPGCVVEVGWVSPTSTFERIYMGRIADAQVDYGIPYQSGFGEADYLTLTIEGNFARLARAAGNDYVMASAALDDQLQTAATQTNIGIFSELVGGSNPTLDTFTVSGNWGEWLNRVLTTINGRLWDAYDADTLTVVSPFFRDGTPFRFSDTANNSTNQIYDKITFSSFADNYYTQVTVDPQTASPATVTAVGATAPFRTLLTNTLNSTTGQATDYANYLLANFGEREPRITSVSCTGDQQASFSLWEAGRTPGHLAQSPGHLVEVVFRGSTIQCVIEGVSFSATPDGSRFTFYLSDRDLNAYLILDDAVFGKLDENRLGY